MDWRDRRKRGADFSAASRYGGSRQSLFFAVTNRSGKTRARPSTRESATVRGMTRGVARWIIPIAVPAAFLSCGLADPGQPPATDDAAPTEPGPEAAPASAIDNETRVTLERTQCYGPCPVYTLSVAGDGTVAYFGTRYVK